MRVNCDAGDDFDQLWRKVVDELDIVRGELPEPARSTLEQPFSECASLLTNGIVNPSIVRVALRKITQAAPRRDFL